SGLATFSDLVITGVAGDRTLSFTATGITAATSNTITVNAGAATALAIATQPSATATSGSAFAQQPAVQLKDASGNNVAQENVEVTVAIASGNGTLGGTLKALTNASGLATFSNLAITGVAGDRTLSFTAAGLTAATSNTITVNAGAATALAITTQPSATAVSGSAFAQQPAVQLKDVSGNNVAQSGVVITASVATGSGNLAGTLTATTNASGLATFSDLVITGVAGDRTLSFTATGITAATSNTITVNAGAATALAIATQPSATAVSGSAFAQQPAVQLKDASGNNVAQSGVVITASVATGSGNLAGTLTATTNASGLATFSDLVITGVAGDRTLSFTATGITAATSNTITVNAGAATALAIATQPSATAVSGSAFAQQPAVQLKDASGNNVAQSGVVITASVATGSGNLAGTLTATTNASGLATFSDLVITGVAGDRTLSFTAAGLTTATSNTITVNAGAATKLAIATQSSATAVSGSAFAQQPAVQLKDVSGNNVAQSGVVITASVATGSGNLAGTLTATTNASGLATFSDLVITGIAGDRTLSFTAAGLTAATSNTITVNAGSATALAITTQPSATAVSGSAFAQQPAVQLKDASGNNVAQSGVVITASVATGSGNLAGTLTATTNASGLATFSDLVITGVAGDRTLSFTATGITAATSNTITVNAGAATQLAISMQPSALAKSGQLLGTQPVIQLLDASGNEVKEAGIDVTVSLHDGNATLLGSLTVKTDNNGKAIFNTLFITGIEGNRTFRFQAPGLTSIVSNPVSITDPFELAVIAKADVSCFGTASGSVTVAGEGGSTPYKYKVNDNDYQLSGNFTGLSAGSYVITVEDAAGVSTSKIITIVQPSAALKVTVANQTNILSYGASSGKIDINVSNGTAPYSYSWNNQSTSQNLSNIPAGIYTVTVTDAKGCTATASSEILQPSAALAIAVVTKTDITSFGASTGAVTVSGSGGTGPYEYQLGNGTYQTNGTFTGLPAGTYTLTIKDANGVSSTTTITISQPSAALAVNVVNKTDITSFGASTGALTVAGSGGTGPYEYKLGNGTYQTNGTFTGLPAGTYTLTIKDANGVTSTTTVTISQPSTGLSLAVSTKANASIYNTATGSVTLTASGGTGPYEYKLDAGYQTSAVFNNLRAKTYTGTVKDGNGITATVTFTIEQPAALTLSLVSKRDVMLGEINSGSIKVKAEGGVGPYTYKLTNGAYQGSETFENLLAGSYRVTVKDANGATQEIEVTINGVSVSNVFTPNGDGMNDTFEIVGIENYDSADLTIFNRWGNEVFRDGKYKNTWDGTGLNAGTYFFILKLNKAGKQETRKGWVLIQR
ncbi:gliding motility-associated C-terminal domain-containing protein, partial [Desertivirga brevis]|uniref:T9SS type B sorting domain-containing protein n=1 Tax=Desertivirga brevis TaxID=2810310 RepID=UPI001A962FBE